MDMHTQFDTGGLFVLFSFIPLILNLLLIIFAIYFIVKVIKFMNNKIELDRVKNEKLTELIKVLHQNKDVH
ncbi:hypothetical protein [Sporosarcina sp.]|uniref:hypothetical protein n=1 Tax=Sporosarcina sp. TaxID=49982 RepID=UPI0026071481|nr:hypothetical protein [Sporosarcina sp.]